MHFNSLATRSAILAACLVLGLPGWGTADPGVHRSSHESSASARPNLVFFLVDDLGWQDTSVAFWIRPTPMQRHFRTPHVRRLAEQGLRFSSAYSCAVCSPTRTSILTGQNAARHRVTNWTLFGNLDQSGTTNRLGPPENWNLRGLQPDQVTLPKILRAAGYTTIHCGKAHWGAYGTAGADPRTLGFDVNIAGHPAGAPASYQGQDNFGNQPAGSHQPPWGVPGLEKYHGTDTHLTEALTLEALDALDEAARSDRPFFLYFAPYAVHTPIQPHPRFIDNYRGQRYPDSDLEIPEVEARYASMVEGYDAALGAVLDKLDQLQVADNTLIVFTSDNGGLSAHTREVTPRGTGRDTHCWPLREGKGSAYEGGIRVPLVVSWARPDPRSAQQQQLPIVPGSRTDYPVICEDFLPTMCGWAGIDVDQVIRELSTAVDPASASSPPDHPLDGIDWTPLITGPSEPEKRPLIFHYPHVWGPRGPGYQPHSAMRWGNFKLIYFYHSRRWELYDLAEDLGEQHNLIFDEPAASQRLVQVMQQRLKELEFQQPQLRPSVEYVADVPFVDCPTIQPRPSSEDRAAAAGWLQGGTWLDQHQDINEIARQGRAQLVFLGDSITQSWGGPGRQVANPGQEVWDRFYGDRPAANFGISGDRTQHLLWRIKNGNLDGLNPKVVVVLIGTNNLADNSAVEIAAGIQQIVLQLEERRDASKILLLGLLPRGQRPDDPLRLKTQQVNRMISVLDEGRKTHYLDISEALLDRAGMARPEMYRDDFLHLSPEGYRAWAAAMEPVIEPWLK